jgi:hypothetical protein
LNADNGLGFAPHGAGRNFSRTAYMSRSDIEPALVAHELAVR